MASVGHNMLNKYLLYITRHEIFCVLAIIYIYTHTHKYIYRIGSIDDITALYNLQSLLHIAVTTFVSHNDPLAGVMVSETTQGND